MILTSNYQTWQHYKFEPVGILKTPIPIYSSIPVYEPLCPPQDLVEAYKTDSSAWGVLRDTYQQQLSLLDVREVVEDLYSMARHPVLVSNGSIKQPNYRRITAEWLEKELGEIVPEYSLTYKRYLLFR